MDAAEQQPRDDRRLQRPPPVAQRREDVAAKQDLLADRRDHARQRCARDQQRRAFVGAERFEHFLFARMGRRGPQLAQDDEGHEQRGRIRPTAGAPADTRAAQARPARRCTVRPPMWASRSPPARTHVLDHGVRDRHAGGVCELVIFAPSASARTSTMRPPTSASASPAISASGAVHGGQPVVGEREASPSVRVDATPMPPNARWQTERGSRPISAADSTHRGRCRRGRSTSHAASQDAEREQHQQEARQRQQGLRGHGVGERQRERREHVDAVGERQPAQHADDGGDRRRQKRDQHQVVPGHHERAVFAGGEVDVMALAREQLASALERRAHAVPDAHVGTGEVPAPDFLGVNGASASPPASAR